jgi:hypothetical protein
MYDLGINILNKPAMLKIMAEASSDICRLYQRELKCGMPFIYSREDISYIYGLPQDEVNRVCDELGFVNITSFILPQVFCRITSF